MEQQLQTRLKGLRSEFERGTERLRRLESEVRDVQHVLLRISGAIQVLEEELARATSSGSVEMSIGSHSAADGDAAALRLDSLDPT